MFLNELNQDEKVAFMELAHLIANSNGILHENEKKMLDTYDREMSLDLQISDLEELSLEKIVPIFGSKRVKRIVFLEAIAVAFSDGVYHEEQKNLIEELKIAFQFSDEEYEEFRGWIIKMNALYAQANELISV